MFGHVLNLLFASITGLSCVFGATCVTKPTCERTDYTLPLCVSGTCACLNSSFVPIRSGCALQMDKPAIVTDSGSSNQVMFGRYFTLYCNRASGAATFEWYLGSTKLNATTDTYSTVASASNVGSFRCRGIGPESVVTSPLSDSFIVEMLGGPGGLSRSNVRPTINLATTAAFNGSYELIYCQNTPMGFTDIKYTVNGVDTGHLDVTIDSTNAGQEVTCTLTSPSSGVTFSNPTSAVAKLPTLVTNILNVTVLNRNKAFLECSFLPNMKEYGTRKFTFTWLMDGKTVDNESSPIFFPSVVGSYDVTCTVQMDNQTVVPSINTFRVNIVDDAGLKASATRPLQGGRVILVCGGRTSDQHRYQWGKGKYDIVGQYDRKLQLDNVSAQDNGVYICGQEHRVQKIFSTSIEQQA